MPPIQAHAEVYPSFLWLIDNLADSYKRCHICCTFLSFCDNFYPGSPYIHGRKVALQVSGMFLLYDHDIYF